MYEEIAWLAKALCDAEGTSGAEDAAFAVAARELAFCDTVKIDPLGGVTGVLGDPTSERRILLDAHIDQIGLAVTNIDDDGFLRVTNVGGIDRRTMPGTRVTVFGSEPVTGVVCVLPPHLKKSGEEKIAPVPEQAIDVGMTKAEAERYISVGDRAVLVNPVERMLGNRVTGSALDDRSGCACIIRAAQLLKDTHFDGCVTVLCSTREETGGQGAKISAYTANPTEAIAVDVSFAQQPGTENLVSKLGGGPMIGFSAALDRRMSRALIALAQRHGIPYQLEAMGGSTGTNCDEISVTRGGVRTGLISVPQRNMHTPAEVCDLEDMENIARLIAAYVTEGGKTE